METVKDYIIQNPFLITSIILFIFTCIFLVYYSWKIRKLKSIIKLLDSKNDKLIKFKENSIDNLARLYNSETDKLRNIHEGQVRRLQEENKGHRDNNRKLAMDKAIVMGFGMNKTIDMATMIYKFYSGK
jgi:cell division protein FtsB